VCGHGGLMVVSHPSGSFAVLDATCQGFSGEGLR